MEVSVVDPVALLGLGILLALIYSRWLQPRNPDWHVFLSVLMVGLFWLHAATVELLGVQPWGIAPAASVSPVVGIFVVLAYPFWLKIGAEAVFLLTGRSPQEGGLLWVLRLRDGTESFEPHWRK